MIRRTLAALALLALALAPTPALAAWQEDGKVVNVVDGDTVDVRFPGTTAPTRIRLIGIDAPEQGECGYSEARDALRTLLVGKVVTVEFDPKTDLHDRYGRTLGYLWLGETLFEDATVNEALVFSGLAREYTYRGQEYTYRSHMRDAQRQAQRDVLGIWDWCQ